MVSPSIGWGVPLTVAAIISVSLAVFAWQRRRAPSAIPFVVLSLAMGAWSAAYAGEYWSLDLSGKLLWAKIQYFGITVVPVAWLVLALRYSSSQTRITNPLLLLATVVPVVTLVLVWTNDAHGLMWSQVTLDVQGLFLVLAVTHGAFFCVYLGHSYALVLLGIGFFVQAYIRSSRLYRQQARVILIGAIVPLLGSALYVSGLGPGSLDLTPFAFTISMILLAWGLFRQHMFVLTPIARDVVVEEMRDGVIVLDSQDRIVDLNRVAQEIFDRPTSGTIGQLVQRASSDLADTIGQLQDTDTSDLEIVLGSGQDQGQYNFSISTLTSDQGQRAGRVIVLRDIIEHKRIEEELRLHHEYLEDLVEQRTAELNRTNEEMQMEITERKQAEESLRESEARYRSLFENAHDMIQSVAPDGRFVFVNQAWLETLDYTEAQLPDLNLFEIIHPESFPHCQEMFSKVMAGESLSGVQATFVARDGRPIVVEGNVTPRVMEGRLIATHGFFRDITERRRAEQALRESEERFRTLFESTREGIPRLQMGTSYPRTRRPQQSWAMTARMN